MRLTDVQVEAIARDEVYLAAVNGIYVTIDPSRPGERLPVPTPRALCVALAAEVRERRAQAGWQPIATYGADPLNPNPIVLRPHRIHGSMDVRRLTEAELESFQRGGVLTRDIDWQWLNGDSTTAWVEASFLPYWMPLPAPPQEVTHDHAA